MQANIPVPLFCGSFKSKNIAKRYFYMSVFRCYFIRNNFRLVSMTKIEKRLPLQKNRAKSMKLNLSVTLALGTALCSTFAAKAAQDKPNILLIISDDQGYADYSRRCPQNVRTPNIDKLAEQSMVFRQFHVETASAPTRASLLTGKIFIRTGVTSVHWGMDYINQEETLLPQVMKKAGYNTALIGKWHSGKGPGYLPQDRGFDYVQSATMHEHLDSDMCFNDAPTVLRGKSPYYVVKDKKGWTLDRMADEAAAYFDLIAKSDKPFFLQLAYVAPHAPWIADKTLIDSYLAQGQSLAFASLNGLVEQLDGSIAKVLQSLDNAGLSKNTIVIFFSDNGYVHSGPNLTLSETDIKLRNPDNIRGTKGDIYEGGILSPMLVRWPGVVEPGANDRLTHVTDILPTFAEIGGLKKSDLPPHLDGESFLNCLKNNDYKPDDRIVVSSLMRIPGNGNYTLKPGQDMDKVLRNVSYATAGLYARNDRFKLVKDPKSGLALYDMKSDPRETTDVSAKFPAERAKLETAMKRWFDDMLKNDKFAYNKPLFHIGKFSNTVIYFNGAWNITGDLAGVGQWSHCLSATKAGSSALWKVTVDKAGKYRAWLEATVKSPVKVEFGGGSSFIRTTLQAGKLFDLGNIDIASGLKELKFTILGDENGGDVPIPELWNIVFMED